MNSKVLSLTLLILLSTPQLLFAAEPAILWVDAAEGSPETTALHLLTTQALRDRGLSLVNTAASPQASSPEAAAELAQERGAKRLFILHLAPMQETVLAILEEVSVRNGSSIHSSRLIIAEAIDSDRVIRRLVRAVLDRAAVEDGQTVSTVTTAEAHSFSKRPGEFLWGVNVSAGFGVSNSDVLAGSYGATLRFAYEIENANIALTIGGAGSDESGLFETSVRGHYLFGESNVAGFLGGGLGISVLGMDGYQSQFGAHAIISGGIEAMRLHSARLFVSADILFPLYKLESSSYDDYYGDYLDESPERAGSTYAIVPTLNIGILF